MNIWLQLFIPLIVGVLVGCILRVFVLIMKDKGLKLSINMYFFNHDTHLYSFVVTWILEFNDKKRYIFLAYNNYMEQQLSIQKKE